MHDMQPAERHLYHLAHKTLRTATPGGMTPAHARRIIARLEAKYAQP